MSAKSWDDESPLGDDGYERGLHERELEDKRQAYEHKEEIHKQRQRLFELFERYSKWMLGVGYFFVCVVVFHPSTQGAVIAGIVLMIPVVITLAMIRMLYGNKNDENAEKTAPSIVLNVGKELAGVLKLYLKGGGGGPA